MLPAAQAVALDHQDAHAVHGLRQPHDLGMVPHEFGHLPRVGRLDAHEPRQEQFLVRVLVVDADDAAPRRTVERKKVHGVVVVAELQFRIRR